MRGCRDELVAAAEHILARFTAPFEIPARGEWPARRRPASHGGSHPHLVHEFVSSIVDERPSAIDASTAAAWTAPGICAHESAMRGGASVNVPDFSELGDLTAATDVTDVSDVAG